LQKETKQGYDNKTYPKLVLNKLKVMENYTSILYPLGFSLKEVFQEAFNLHAAHVRPFAPMCEL
jgi:hypothetical protein